MLTVSSLQSTERKLNCLLILDFAKKADVSCAGRKENTHFTINAIVSSDAGVLSSNTGASRVIILYTNLNKQDPNYL